MRPLPVVFAIAIIALVGLSFVTLEAIPSPEAETIPVLQQTAAISAASSSESAAPPPAPKRGEPTAPSPNPEPPSDEAATIHRIENPYTFPALPFSAVNEHARSALVNIFCTSQSGEIRPISGSGVLIDARGVVLTNAHVAQYVLLSQNSRIDLVCTVRTGGPAHAIGGLEIVYLPPEWIYEHAKDLTKAVATGTGEHDYALLRIISPTVASFPYLAIDTREGIGFVDDRVLAAGYAAEFTGGIASLNNLYPVSSIAPIGELLTFGLDAPDVLAIRGVLEAQSGASGGAVVNGWDRLIGIITTTSSGATTAERTLHAITLSYIDKDLTAQSGSGLQATLGGDIALQAANFRASQGIALSGLILEQIRKPR